ncbi:hypothetical protein CAP36_07185 [Chitinophagaceae bacterium IBVUCB2]|nr:hypothetical protein CAP36_07185 [Chitinophagaceae bacterium IBVUCB2]
MSTEKMIAVIRDISKEKEYEKMYSLEDGSFMMRALIRNAASRKKYSSNKLLLEQQENKNQLHISAAESWLLTGS